MTLLHEVRLQVVAVEVGATEDLIVTPRQHAHDHAVHLERVDQLLHQLQLRALRRLRDLLTRLHARTHRQVRVHRVRELATRADVVVVVL